MRSLQPERVFHYFRKISAIPRCTGNEQQISDYLNKTALSMGLKTEQDAFGNLIIHKPGQLGREYGPPIILQGHMDMLCLKEPEGAHDFEKGEIPWYVSGDLIMTDGVSLGADNGIGIAMYMAILESADIPHPPLEVVLTVQEEAGLIGAQAVEVSQLKGRYLVNTASEVEGEFIIGCAGEQRVEIDFELEHGNAENMRPMAIQITGLKGGHSGVDMHRNRGNAIKLMAVLLNRLQEHYKLLVGMVSGGAKVNVLPYEALAEMWVPVGSEDEIEKEVRRIARDLAGGVEQAPELSFAVQMLQEAAPPLLPLYSENLISLLIGVPDGIRYMHSQMEGLVDTSVNLGSVRWRGDHMELLLSVRSSTPARETMVLEEIKSISKGYGAAVKLRNAYPHWPIERGVHLQRMFIDYWRELFGNEPKLTAVHAGLECSILGRKLNERANKPPIEMIAIGPDLFDAHTMCEAVSVSSVQRVWRFLVEVLERLE